MAGGKCPDCGNFVSMSANFCPKCGNRAFKAHTDWYDRCPDCTAVGKRFGWTMALGVFDIECATCNGSGVKRSGRDFDRREVSSVQIPPGAFADYHVARHAIGESREVRLADARRKANAQYDEAWWSAQKGKAARMLPGVVGIAILLTWAWLRSL